MQLFKSIALFSLLSIQSLAGPINDSPRDSTSDVAKLEARADPPAGAQDVGMGARERGLSGHALKTDGLASCLAIVIRSPTPGPTNKYDKLLAHVSPTFCETKDLPSMYRQLDNIWEEYDTQPFDQPQLFLIYPNNDEPGQATFNGDVSTKLQTEAAKRGVSCTGIARDLTNVNKPGGSRLWIDETQHIYWSLDDKPIA